MNQDIIDYLEGYWELKDTSVRHVGKTLFERESNAGCLSYFPETNILLISSDGWYGYEVEIQDLQHLIQLEALL